MSVRPARGTLVVAAAILGSGTALLDGTAVNVILPLVQRDLRANAQFVQWVVEGYALFLSALILVGGALGDVYGRRKMFVLGTALFTAASIGCAFAQSMEQLIVARCVQGIGAALLVPESLALISAQFEPKERGKRSERGRPSPRSVARLARCWAASSRKAFRGAGYSC